MIIVIVVYQGILNQLIRIHVFKFVQMAIFNQEIIVNYAIANVKNVNYIPKIARNVKQIFNSSKDNVIRFVLKGISTINHNILL